MSESWLGQNDEEDESQQRLYILAITVWLLQPEEVGKDITESSEPFQSVHGRSKHDGNQQRMSR
jgi:hypothetical protein